MPGLLERAASRYLGLPTREQVTSLQTQVEELTARARMRPMASGVEIDFGEYSYEYIQGLRGDARWDVYDRMESDPLVKEGLDSIVLPLCTGKWEIQSASDKAIDIEIKEFVEANLLRVSSDRYGREFFVQTSWAGQRLVEILDCLKCGFALFAKSTREVNGKIVYDRIQWLEPRSVDPHGWELSDTDELIQVARTYKTPGTNFKFREPLPARQVALYPWDFKGARYEGRPKIRSLYGSFIRKDSFVRTAAIWAQKAGAPMPIGYYPQVWGPDKKFAFENIVKSVRGQAPAEAYGMIPIEADGTMAVVKFAGMEGEAAGQVDRMRSLINGENAELAHGMNTKSRLLGETGHGSRAVGQTQSEDEDVGVDAVVKRICEIENDGVANLPGLIQELVDWNFPNVRKYPQLVCSRVGPREDFRTLDPMLKAVEAGVIPNVPALRKQVTEKFGINLTDADYAKEPAPKLMVGPEELSTPPASKGKTPAKGDASRQSKTAPADAGGAQNIAADVRIARQMDFRLGMERLLRLPDASFPTKVPQGFGRPPTRFESQMCLLGMVSDSLTKGGEQIGSALRRATSTMTEDLLSRIEGGKLKRESSTRLRQSRPKGEGAMVSSIRERFLDVARAGRQHANEELARQRELAGKIKAGTFSRTALSFADIALATPPEDESNILPPGSNIPVGARAASEIGSLIESAGGSWQVMSVLTTELAGEARVASQIALDEIWARLVDEAIREYDAAIRAGLSEAEAFKHVEAALHGLSPSKQDLAARQVAEIAYNQGRDMAAKEAAVAGQAHWVVRSEVLDQRTCATCAQLDGVYLKIGTKEYEQYLPPARCEGGDNCRGFAVIVSDELARQLDREEAA